MKRRAIGIVVAAGLAVACTGGDEPAEPEQRNVGVAEVVAEPVVAVGRRDGLSCSALRVSKEAGRGEVGRL